MLVCPIVHCWRYSRALTYQLSSLVLHRPECEIKVAVCFTWEDTPTVRALDFFEEKLPGVVVRIPQEREYLLRRSIGRNLAVDRLPNADFLLFADADYFFGPGALDAVAALDPAASPLFFPKTVHINVDHATGDQYARWAVEPKVLGVCPGHFKPQTMRLAIGGVQWVPGTIAREHGYCRNQIRHQTPVGPTYDRMDFRSDIAFRKILGTRGLPVDVPNVYRIRQTQTGVVDQL